MTKSLKSRASAEVMSAEGVVGSGADAEATATDNGLAIGSENGDEVRVLIIIIAVRLPQQGGRSKVVSRYKTVEIAWALMHCGIALITGLNKAASPDKPVVLLWHTTAITAPPFCCAVIRVMFLFLVDPLLSLLSFLVVNFCCCCLSYCIRQWFGNRA